MMLRSRPIASPGTRSAIGMWSCSKPALQGADGANKDETRATTAFMLDRIVTSASTRSCRTSRRNWWAAYAENAGQASTLLCVQDWPTPTGVSDPAAEAEIGFIVDLITEIRSARSEMNVPVATVAPLVFVGLDAATRARAEASADILRRSPAFPS